MPLLLSVAVVMLLVDPEPPKKRDLNAIQGTWSETLIEAGGRKQPKNSLFSVEVIFEGDKVLAKVGRREPELRGILRMDQERKPKHFDLTTPEGHVVPAIYELDGDTMRVCVSGIDEDRPTSFKTTRENDWSLVIYKREKRAGK